MPSKIATVSFVCCLVLIRAGLAAGQESAPAKATPPAEDQAEPSTGSSSDADEADEADDEAEASPNPAAPPRASQRSLRGPKPEVTDRDAAMAVAKIFFASLIVSDARAAVENSSLPFLLEDRKFTSADDLLQEWLKQLRQKRTDLLTLYGIEILSPSEMVKKYGKPPRRLWAFPLYASRTYVAVANLSGHAAVALLREQGGRFRAVAYHD